MGEVTENTVAALADRVISDRKGVTADEAVMLADAPLEVLLKEAARITESSASRRFDTCSIINGKSGRCPENCKWGKMQVVRSVRALSLQYKGIYPVRQDETHRSRRV